MEGQQQLNNYPSYPSYNINIPQNQIQSNNLQRNPNNDFHYPSLNLSDNIPMGIPLNNHPNSNTNNFQNQKQDQYYGKSNSTPFEEIPTSKDAQSMFCGNCKEHVKTVIRRTPGIGATVFSALLCCCGLPFLFWIPCCIPDCLDSLHICPKCGYELGSVKFMGAD